MHIVKVSVEVYVTKMFFCAPKVQGTPLINFVNFI